jgi:hypothetical protein
VVAVRSDTTKTGDQGGVAATLATSAKRGSSWLNALWSSQQGSHGIPTWWWGRGGHLGSLGQVSGVWGRPLRFRVGLKGICDQL